MKPFDYLFGQNYIDQAQRALRMAHWPEIDGAHGFTGLEERPITLTHYIEWGNTEEGPNVWSVRYTEMYEACER